MASPEDELARLRTEVHAKDETLNQLKLKTKAFVDNMRGELAAEKKKVAELEQQLKAAAAIATAAPALEASGEHQQQLESLKKEMQAATHREQELKARAKTFADSMKSQLAAEKDKALKLEAELQDKTAALTQAKSSAASASTEEMASLQVQLSQANQQVAMMGDRLRNAEAQATESASLADQLRRELEELQAASKQQNAQLQGEIELLKSHERDLESVVDTQRSSASMLSAEHSRLEEAERRGEELGRQLEQYKIENEHLQKQLLDKDFQLEQLDNYRKKADASEAKMNESRAEVAVLRGQLQAKSDELAGFQCQTCEALKLELGELQGTKQQLVSAQQRQEELAKQNVQLSEQVAQRDASVDKLREDAGRLMTELAQLQAQLSSSKSSSFETKQRSEAAEVERLKAEEALKTLQQRCVQLESTNVELAASVAAATKDSLEKRQKAKALVISLTNEKQTLADAKSELQKEVERLRMELNQRNVEAEKRLKQLQEESSHKMAQSSSSIQGLSDEISTLKQTLAIVQESEKNQQRAKELASAKREVEDANKKRLAAKAETQKLALELESMHKCLTHLAEHAGATCMGDVRKMNQLHDRVSEALQVLEKRAAASSSGKKAAGNSANVEAEAEDLRGPETATATSPTGSARSLTGFPASGTKKVEDSITQVDERVRRNAWSWFGWRREGGYD
jgi:chromosome segregation ATPase